jgi:hypothetical protein
MKKNLKFTLLSSGSLLAMLFLARTFSFVTGHSAALNSISVSPKPETGARVVNGALDQSEKSNSNQTPVDLNTGLQEALAEKDSARRHELLRQWALAVPLSDMTVMLEWSVTIRDSQERFEEVPRALVARWAAEAPASAADVLARHSAAMPDNSNGSPQWINLLGQLVIQWAPADPNQALTWAQSLPIGPARSEALAQMSSQLRSEAGQRAQRDPQAAAAWAISLPLGEARDGVIANLATTWAHQDPLAAATYAASLPQGNAQNQAVVGVASTWALIDPMQTAQWVGQFSEGPVRQQALQGLIVAWTGKDAKGVSQWLQALPQSPSRDLAVNAFCSSIGQSSPATAFHWAETISNESVRNLQLQTVADTWLQKDSRAAQEGITQSNLPQEIKSRLLPDVTQ